MALVVEITGRLSGSNCRKGANSAYAESRIFTMAEYVLPHFSGALINSGASGGLAGREVDRTQVGGDCRPVRAGGVVERIAQRADHACLVDGLATKPSASRRAPGRRLLRGLRPWCRAS